MKRVNSLIIITVFVLGAMLPSCQDVLDIAPDGNLDMNDVLVDCRKLIRQKPVKHSQQFVIAFHFRTCPFGVYHRVI